MAGPPATLRVALVGYGLGGSAFHAPFIDFEPRLELSAIVTSDPERRAEARRRYPDAQLIPTFDDLLATIDEVHLVVVTTPNATHVPLAEESLSARRHVVVDKPVAPTSGEVRRLASLAGEVDRRLIPFQNRRWDGDFRTVVQLLESGRLGPLHRFESRFERWQPEVPTSPVRSWRRDPSPGSATGVLYDLGPHLIDQAVAVFGRPRHVYAEIASRRPGADVDDDAFVALEYPDGLLAHLWMSLVAADRGPRFRLLGANGAYVKYGMDVQEAALMAGHGPRERGWGEEPPDAWGFVVTGHENVPQPTLTGAYQLFYAGVAACVLDGGRPPVDVADAVITAEIVEAAQRSAYGHTVCQL
jgi:predicted dehydrogenase